MKTPGERIRQAREHKGITAHKLALAVGYKTQSGISNIENRSVTTGGRKIAAIAHELRLPLEWVMNGPDGPTIPWLEPPSKPAPATATPISTQEPGSGVYEANAHKISVDLLDIYTREAVRIMLSLQEHEKRGAVATLRTYVHHLGPPRFGHDLPVAQATKHAHAA